MIKLTNVQKELLLENKIDTLLFYFDKNEAIDLKNYSFELNNKIYKVVHFDVVNFGELLRYLDPSSVYMNRFNGYRYETLTGGYEIRSAHKFRNFLKDFLPENYDFNNLKKDLLIIKLNNLDLKDF